MGRLFKYVALGDSSGVGVGSNLDGGYPERLFRRLKAERLPVGILNLAQSGATSETVLREQVERAAPKQPDLVTLGVGVNDVWRLVPAASFEANLDGIASRLAATAGAVVVATLPDMSLAPIFAWVETLLHVPRAVLVARVVELNEALVRVAQRHALELVDLFAVSREVLAGRPEHFHEDGFHPSSLGYDRLAEALWPTVSRIALTWSERTD